MKRILLPIILVMAACGKKTEQGPGPAAPPKTGPAAIKMAGGDYRVTGPYVHENLAVYLVHMDKRDEREFVTLDEGLKSKSVEVTEQEQEQVNQLTLENKGDRPLFIQEGDRVIGGKQDRIVGMSFVVPPHSGKMPIPSFCVEQGRWTAGTAGNQFFNMENNALASKPIREAAKYRKDQGGVWTVVAEEKAATGTVLAVPSTGSSLNEALEDEKVKKLCETYEAAFADVVEKNKDAVGVAIVLNGRIEEIDLYPGHALLAKLYPRLIRSYATSAAVEKGPAAQAPPAAEIARFMSEGGGKDRRIEKVNDKNTVYMLDCLEQLQSETQYEGKAVHSQWMRKSGEARPEGRQNLNRGNNEVQRQDQQPRQEEQRQR